MPGETPSPIDLPNDPLDAAGLGWAAGVIAIAALFLLVTNAIALRDWIEELTPSPAQAQAEAIADQWVGMTDAIGIGKPRAWLHERWKAIEQARFATS